ncbi:hypothetical protein ABZY44_08410 [Streptomyces sp. NPDC006544]|uniref:hypothetical protein n=1 Tax=Streptomyces sp. NPDC006544 TaxID=3154583 RepID=UPI00339E2365
MNEDEDRKVSSEEQALRDLMLGAVGGIKPSADALERLRYAVPVRRARKRQTLVAAAAAALLVGTAVPAALHVSGAQSGPADHPAMAGHAQQGGNRQDGASDPHQNGAGTAAPRPVRSPGAEQGAGGALGGAATPPDASLPGGGANAGPTGGSVVLPGGSAFGGGVMLPPPAVPGVATCSPEQLGVSGSARPPEADGKVYGSFKVTNVSMRGCTAVGPDTVTAAPAAAPGTGKDTSGAPSVAVVGHTAGDPATGLPAPSAETPLVVLAPNAAYEVRFAWVPPQQGCPAPAASTGSSPTQGGSSGTGTGLRTGTGSGAESGDGVTKDPERQPVPVTDPVALAVSHTPSTPLPGAPVTQTTIPDACGGTVYRTGVIPLAEPPRP